jgi:Skp family chaperone for outer membrane proteins
MKIPKLETIWRSFFSLAFVVALGATPVKAQQQPAPKGQTQPQAPRPAPAAEPRQEALPQELPAAGTPFVVIDMVLILRDSNAAKGVRGQLEKQRNTFQTDIQKQEKDLRAADEELAKQRAILSPEAFTQKRRDLEKRVGDAQKAAQDRRRVLDTAFNEAIQRIEQKTFEVVAEIAGERNYQLVLHKANVVVVQTSLEITAEVIRRLNTKLPSVAVKLPQN